VDRYWKMKAAVSGCLLLMQPGAFVQMMDDDSRSMSNHTELKLVMAIAVDRKEDVFFIERLIRGRLTETGQIITGMLMGPDTIQ